MTFNFEHHLADQFYVEVVQVCARLPEERHIEQNCGNHRMQKKQQFNAFASQVLNQIYKFWVQRVFLSHARVYAEPRASSCVPPQTITQDLPGRVACITIEN